MGYPGSERRRYKRMKRPFMTRVRIYQQKTNSGIAQNWDIVKIRNLSADGISFNYHKIIPMGAIVEFSIMLPFSEKPVRCLGSVCRLDANPLDIKDSKRIPIYGIAARFTEIEADKKAIIAKFSQQHNF